MDGAEERRQQVCLFEDEALVADAGLAQKVGRGVEAQAGAWVEAGGVEEDDVEEAQGAGGQAEADDEVVIDLRQLVGEGPGLRVFVELGLPALSIGRRW